MFQESLRLATSIGVFGEDTTRESIAGGSVHCLECFLPLIIREDIDAQDRAEQFTRHDIMSWVTGLVHCRMDVEPVFF
jgi:hypothetical protein